MNVIKLSVIKPGDHTGKMRNKRMGLHCCDMTVYQRLLKQSEAVILTEDSGWCSITANEEHWRLVTRSLDWCMELIGTSTLCCLLCRFVADVSEADGNFTYIDPDHTLTCMSASSVW